MYNEERVTYFAETDARNKCIPFGIKAKDRTRHVYVIGKTGMGKSTLLENMAVQDMKNGEGMAFIDPHGQTADLLLDYVPQERRQDVMYFAPFDLENPISFNIMEDVGYDKRHLVVSGLMSTFKKIWADAWSARMEYILNNTLLALLEYPNATLLSVNRMLSDKHFRKKVVDNIQDASVRAFWVDEFANYTDRFTAEATPAIQNKVGQFTSNPLIRNIIGQPKSSFDLRKMMDEKKIIIVNLSKGRVGEANANLIGSMLITKIYLAAMSRADIDEGVLKKDLPNFYLYVDEFQSFANESFADILSEARKYKLNLTMAHQYIEQMSEEVRAAVFGNVGTMITFRVGAYDAETLEKEFSPTFLAEDLVNLNFAQIYLKLMIDGVGSQPFSARTIPPIPRPEISQKEEIIEISRKAFSRPRAIVENEVRVLLAPTSAPAKSSQGNGQDRRVQNDRNNRQHGSESAPNTARPRYDQKDTGSKNNFIRKQNMPKTPATPLTFAQDPEHSSQHFSEHSSNQNTTEHTQENVATPEQQDKPLSLTILQKKEKQRVFQDTKGPSEEKKNELRSALASLLKNTPNEQNSEEPNQTEQIGKEQGKKESDKEASTTKREISEETLKKVINGEDSQ
ncbi:MAG: type IV secretory system conjugative DNA transfer family protein [Candidatus Paceibacterota bacterium]